MMLGPDLPSTPEIFYKEADARKHTNSSRIAEIQWKISERAYELLDFPNDGVPRLLLDIGCGSGLSGETLSKHGNHWIGLDISQSMLDAASKQEVGRDLVLVELGQGLALRPGVIDGAISISAVQWLCHADKASHDSRRLLKAFFMTLYKCLARGAKAVFQLYAENMDEHEMIMSHAMQAGFTGGMVIDWPHSSEARKAYLVITCGPVPISSTFSNGKGECGGTCTDGSDESEDEESRTFASQLVSALKGSGERQGASPKAKLSVKWAPDVYDPPVTSISHTVKSHQQRSRSKKNKHKHKNRGSRSTRGNGSNKQRMSWDLSTTTVSMNPVMLHVPADLSVLDGFSYSDVEVNEYPTACNESKCCSSFLVSSLGKLRLPMEAT